MDSLACSPHAFSVFVDGKGYTLYNASLSVVSLQPTSWCNDLDKDHPPHMHMLEVLTISQRSADSFSSARSCLGTGTSIDDSRLEVQLDLTRSRASLFEFGDDSHRVFVGYFAEYDVLAV